MPRQGIALLITLLASCWGCATSQRRTATAAYDASQPGEFIRVGSFNVANFGDTDEYSRSLVSLVNIIRQMNADLICLQEVEPNELGRGQADRLVSLLNTAARFYGEMDYEAIVSQQTGDEAYAFLWRHPVHFNDETGLRFLEHERDPDGDDKPTFQRIPVYGMFSAGNYDFYVVNCHLYTRIDGVSSEGRGAEYDAIVAWLKAIASEEEQDAVVLGDFNRFLDGRGRDTRIWPRLMHPGHQTFFRFPLLEAIENAHPSFDPMTKDAPTDALSTTISKKRSIYDQIMISAGSYREFVPDPQLDRDVGIIPFDLSRDYEWPTARWSNAARLLSDHRPIWIAIRTDQSDDD